MRRLVLFSALTILTFSLWADGAGACCHKRNRCGAPRHCFLGLFHKHRQCCDVAPPTCTTVAAPIPPPTPCPYPPVPAYYGYPVYPAPQF